MRWSQVFHYSQFLEKLRKICKAGDETELKSIILVIAAVFVTGSKDFNNIEFCNSDQPLQLTSVLW